MKSAFRTLILTTITFGVLFIWDHSFAASEKSKNTTNSGIETALSDASNEKSRSGSDIQNDSQEEVESSVGEEKNDIKSTDIEKSTDEEKVKKDINTYIIDSYKAQGTKILKDLDVKLQKTIPDPTERKEAYKKIRTALELRKKRIETTKTSDIKKMILEEFLSHMTESLNKKIEEIRT